jgi:hypothetical protein
VVAKLPPPVFSRTVAPAAKARSSLPSPVKSPAARGLPPSLKLVVTAAWKVPSPVELAVAGEVAGGQGAAALAEVGRDRGLEGAVAGEVAHGEGGRGARAGAPRHGELERAVAVAQQHAHAAAGAGHDVLRAVALEVGHGHRLDLLRDEGQPRIDEEGDRALELEGAVAVAQQHVHAAAGGNGQVRLAVAVELAHRQPVQPAADRGQNGRPERAVAVAQQCRHGAVAVGRHDVQLAVAVEVADRHPVGRGADADGPGELEGAVAVAEDHADGAVAVGRHDVLQAVAQDVAHRHRRETAAQGDLDRVLQAAVALAQQHAHRAAGVGRHHAERGPGAQEMSRRHRDRPPGNVGRDRPGKAGDRAVLQASDGEGGPPGRRGSAACPAAQPVPTHEDLRRKRR